MMVATDVPANSKIHPSSYVSKWDGYLAVVYNFPMEFDPKTISELWLVEYLMDVKNAPIKVTHGNEWMIGKPYQNTIGDEKMVENYYGGYTYFKLSKPPRRFWIKRDLDDLDDAQLGKYVRYLRDKGYVDNTEWQISKKSWLFAFKNGIDKLYNVDENAAMQIDRYLKFARLDMNNIRGVITLFKNKFKIKWIVENKRIS